MGRQLLNKVSRSGDRAGLRRSTPALASHTDGGRASASPPDVVHPIRPSLRWKVPTGPGWDVHRLVSHFEIVADGVNTSLRAGLIYLT